jgi:hypothetical protein
MSQPIATTAREVVLGDALRATILTTGAERLWVVSGSMTVWAGADELILRRGVIPMKVPHAIQAGPRVPARSTSARLPGFAELVARAGTPAHLATPDLELDAERFIAVTTELGDVVLGPPGTTPAELAT